MFGRVRPGHPYLGGAPLLIAHRGGAKLGPENTMAAFRQSVTEWDVDMLEMDVRLSGDGHVIVIHDETVDRTTDGSGPIADMSLEQIQELDAGYRFRDLDGRASFASKGVTLPLFEEVLEAFPAMRLNVESKAPEAAAPLVELIRRHGATDRVLVAAEHEYTRAGARGYAGPWGASRDQVRSFWLAHHVPVVRHRYCPPVDAFQVPEVAGRLRVVTPRFVAVAHRWNVPVHVWTVDDPGDMRRLLAMGVDGIQTDRPDVLAEVLMDTDGRPCPPGLASRTSHGPTADPAVASGGPSEDV